VFGEQIRMDSWTFLSFLEHSLLPPLQQEFGTGYIWNLTVLTSDRTHSNKATHSKLFPK
jgi:hypothetical protein